MRKPEPAISRVLSSTTIHLGQSSPTASSNLPGSPLGTGGAHKRYSPIWSCSRRGLPCRELLPVARCALTAPFHPYRPRSAVYFLWHFPWARTLQALPGASSEGARTFLCRPETCSDCLADSCFLGRAILQVQKPLIQRISFLARRLGNGPGNFLVRQLPRQLAQQAIDIN